jgi:hypothetical protein
MSLGVQIMAHPARVSLAEDLAERLGLDGGGITWDQINDPWHTGGRAWRSLAARGTDWSMVIQDDVLPCRDLIPALTAALEHVPGQVIVSPFVGRNQPRGYVRQIAEAVELARVRNASWIMTGALMWGVAICVPTATVAPMVTWCEQMNQWRSYDKRVGQYYKRQHYRTWYTWPSLVDHRDVPSLLAHVNEFHIPERVAHEFVGEDTSALGLDWSGPIQPVWPGGYPEAQGVRRS